MRRSLAGLGFWLALCVGAGQGARAADDWTVVVSPYVWAAGLDGDVALGGIEGQVDLSFGDVLETLDLAVMGNVEVSNGRWGGFVDLLYVRSSDDEAAFGAQVDLTATTRSVAAGLFYRIHDRALGGQTVFGQPRRLAIEPVIGVRWTRLEAGASALGLGGDASAEWTDPFVGLRLRWDLDRYWTLDAEVDSGGLGRGSRSVNAQAYLGYRTQFGDRPVILRAGYRSLSQDFETRDFTGNRFRWDVRQSGPVIGLSFVF
jgi:hypothetical protein